VPPPSLDGFDAQDFHLKTKYSLDLSLFSMDSKMRCLLELDDRRLPMSYYKLCHPADATCLAEAHKEGSGTNEFTLRVVCAFAVIKNGAAGLIVSRLISQQSNRTYYLQSNYRLLYKNGKADSIACTHRLLTYVHKNIVIP
jgi:aryl hydrocarbon receptor